MMEAHPNDILPPSRKRNPLVLVGAVATAGVLTAGLVAFRKVVSPTLSPLSWVLASGHFGTPRN